jgi:hypothetical protein
VVAAVASRSDASSGNLLLMYILHFISLLL